MEYQLDELWLFGGPDRGMTPCWWLGQKWQRGGSRWVISRAKGKKSVMNDGKSADNQIGFRRGLGSPIWALAVKWRDKIAPETTPRKGWGSSPHLSLSKFGERTERMINGRWGGGGMGGYFGKISKVAKNWAPSSDPPPHPNLKKYGKIGKSRESGKSREIFVKTMC